MNKARSLPVILFCLLAVQCCAERGQNASNEQTKGDTTVADRTAEASIPLGARALMEAYPQFVKGYKNNFLLLGDGTQMIYDDGREKSFVEKLDDADPEDMFAFTYDRTTEQPDYLQDAGRSRCEALFKMMYGGSEAAVRQKLILVEWFGERVLFTTVNGAADSLRAVAQELTRHPELRPYLKSSGSFLWRKVRGANRQSAHSYGMTIDVGVSHSDYWLWKNPGKKETDKIVYFNRMPKVLVYIFERHGFIWGGRWYHYDTMHFEFRPEILIYSSSKQ
ncbi:MAG: M15 family metallopeptidase [Bacteroidaceae bacterium]|nr:M15 family metallopeptidase [Bacteroidaceae bacterium]